MGKKGPDTLKSKPARRCFAAILLLTIATGFAVPSHSLPKLSAVLVGDSMAPIQWEYSSLCLSEGFYRRKVRLPRIFY